MALSPLSPADATEGSIRPPELSDAVYSCEVLGQTGGKTEADIDQELAAKASALGIQLPAADHDGAADGQVSSASSGDESARTVAMHHGRTASTSSDETVHSSLTLQSSRQSAVTPVTLREAPNPAARKRSKSLNFAPYDRYLGQLNPALHQPKFLLGPSVPRISRPRSSTLIGIGRGRVVVRDLKRSLADKLKNTRRRSSTSAMM